MLKNKFLLILTIFILIQTVFATGNCLIGGSCGEISFGSSPGGATVYLNGVEYGKTSTGSTAPLTVEMNTGQYDIRATLSGYDDYTGSVTIVQGTNSPFEFTMNQTSTKASINVASDPIDADVYVDGAYKGKTTASTGPVKVDNLDPYVSHSLSVSKSGYQNYSTSFTLSPGEDRGFNINLNSTAKFGKYYITSNPSGAAIAIDGSSTGLITPATLSNISVGTHTISLYKDDYSSYRTSETVYENQTTTINATLSYLESYGSINIASNPNNSDVYIDGRMYGETPLKISNLYTGQHDIRISHVGYEDYVNKITIQKNYTTPLNVVLNQSTTKGDILLNCNQKGASVYVGETYKGITSEYGLDITQLTAGDYSVRVSKSGFEDYYATVSVYNNKTTKLDVSLVESITKPTTGSLYVTSTPSGADVYVNNEYKGLTPIILNQLSDGYYSVKLMMPNYQDAVATYTVYAGKTTDVDLTLNENVNPTPVETDYVPIIVGAVIVLVFAGLIGFILVKRK
ncbi:MAG: PEGA domain-containing protein [Candidatus ainarchaeum sp.]|nr:PEGA domain-containing protein [Candidatus ainarchaeum sp.]